MYKVKVKFKETGTWHDNPWEKPITVNETGEVHAVTAQLAQALIDAGRAEYSLPENPVETVTPDKPIDGDIDVLNLNDSIAKKLNEYGITTVAELVDKSADELAEIKGLGQAKIDDIQEALKLSGLALKT